MKFETSHCRVELGMHEMEVGIDYRGMLWEEKSWTFSPGCREILMSFILVCDVTGSGRLEKMSPEYVCEKGLRTEPQEYTLLSGKPAQAKA